MVTGEQFDALLKCTEDKMPNEMWEEVKCEVAEVAKNIVGIKTVSKAGAQRRIPACGEFQRAPDENVTF